jgi:hypothetical protein
MGVPDRIAGFLEFILPDSGPDFFPLIFAGPDSGLIRQKSGMPDNPAEKNPGSGAGFPDFLEMI